MISGKGFKWRNKRKKATFFRLCLSLQNDIFPPLAEIFDMTAGPVRELFKTAKEESEEEGRTAAARAIPDTPAPINMEEVLVLNDR